jgi:hypothetical protein
MAEATKAVDFGRTAERARDQLLMDSMRPPEGWRDAGLQSSAATAVSLVALVVGYGFIDTPAGKALAVGGIAGLILVGLDAAVTD